jgi:hypothetical protein
MKKQLWEILVPTMFNDKTPVRTRFHKVWDKKVYAITGGITIMTPSKGRWISPDGTLFTERMIPVRISCNREQINRIIDMTMEYYNQEAIMAFLISEDVIIKHRNEKIND